MASTSHNAPTADPFATLGIPDTSSKADVKKAYTKLSLLFHPDKAGQGATARFQEINAAYETITTGRLCFDSRSGVGEDIDDAFSESADRAIWEWPPIPLNLDEGDKFNLLKGRLKRFFQSKKGNGLSNGSQTPSCSSFESQIVAMLDTIESLSQTVTNDLGMAVGQTLHLLKRMWVGYTMGIRSELIDSFRCETMASAIGVLGLLAPRTLRYAMV